MVVEPVGAVRAVGDIRLGRFPAQCPQDRHDRVKHRLPKADVALLVFLVQAMGQDGQRAARRVVIQRRRLVIRCPGGDDVGLPHAQVGLAGKRSGIAR